MNEYYKILLIYGGIVEILYTKDDSGGKINSFGGESIGHFEKNTYMYRTWV